MLTGDASPVTDAFERGLASLRHAAMWGGAALLGGLALVAAVIGLLVAIAITLAPLIGWAGSIAIVSLAVAAVGLVIVAVARQRLNADRAPDGADEHAESDQESLPMPSGTSHPTAEFTASSSTDDTGCRDWKDEAAALAARNPGVVASGALLVFAILGPSRTFKFASRGLMFASLASSLLEQIGEDQNKGTVSSAPPPSSTRPRPAGSPGGVSSGRAAAAAPGSTRPGVARNSHN